MDKLIHAAEKGDAKKVAKFLQKGANPDVSDNFGWTPLYRAVIKGHKEIVEILLIGGADVDKRTGGVTPLGWAAEAGNTEIVKLLLDHKADINAPGKEGASPLYSAVNYGRKDVIKLLLEHGADVNAREEKYNWCPLHVAVHTRFGPLGVDNEKNRSEVLDLLVKFGADVNAKEGSNGWLPLHVACLAGRKNLAEILLDGGADVNAVDNNGMTPLLWVATEGVIDCARLLLDRGADVNMRVSGSGASPLRLAKKFDQPMLAELISQHGGVE